MTSPWQTLRRRRQLGLLRKQLVPGVTIVIPRDAGCSYARAGRWVVCRLLTLRHTAHVEIEQSHGGERKVLALDSILSIHRAEIAKVH